MQQKKKKKKCGRAPPPGHLLVLRCRPVWSCKRADFWSLDPELGLKIEEKLKRVILISKPKAPQIIQIKNKKQIKKQKTNKQTNKFGKKIVLCWSIILPSPFWFKEILPVHWYLIVQNFEVQNTIDKLILY